jgi:hypothetical protein
MTEEEKRNREREIGELLGERMTEEEIKEANETSVEEHIAEFHKACEAFANLSQKPPLSEEEIIEQREFFRKRREERAKLRKERATLRGETEGRTILNDKPWL